MDKKKLQKGVRTGIWGFDILLIALIIFLAIASILNKTFFESYFSLWIETYGLTSLFLISLLLELIPQFITPLLILVPSLFIVGLNPHMVIFAVFIEIN